ncbi:MAG: DUF2192 domain-containing protein [Pyrodictiaceae archaeon]
MSSELSRRQTKSLHRERITAAMEVISAILRGDIKTREDAVKMLQEAYRRHAVSPLRGKAWPSDIWDKEMATLYVVAKYALGLGNDAPRAYHEVFSVEEALEDAANAILTMDDENARRYLSFMLGGSLDDNTIARMLRVVATSVMLGFRSEDDMEKILTRLPKLIPDLEAITRKYSRFYIALRTAQEIALGKIRDRISKEAFKQAIAARIGLDKIIPDDEYIAFIARTVFKVGKKRIERILAVGGRGKTKTRKKEKKEKLKDRT